MALSDTIRVLQDAPAEQWDAFAAECRSPWHSSGGAALQRESGVPALFLGGMEDGTLHTGVTVHLPGSRRAPILDGILFRQAFVPDGPMVRGGDLGAARGVIDAVERELSRVAAVEVTWRFELPVPELREEFARRGYAIAGFGVGIMDMPGDEAEIDASIHGKSRNLCRRAVKSGIRVEAESGVESLLPLLDRSFERADLLPRDHAYVRKAHAILKSEVLVARKGPDAVAALMWRPFGTMGCYLFHGRVDGDTEGASNLLLREMFVRGIRAGVRTFHAGDMALPGETDPRLLGIAHFKSRMGFRAVPTFEARRTLRPLAKAVREIARGARGRLKRVRGR